MTPELVMIDVRPGGFGESQSGLQTMQPRIWGAFLRPHGARTAAIIMHPTSNFMGHYLLAPLARRGVATLGLNSRYVGNDAALLLERVIQDLGAGVAWLRAAGFDRVVLIGNSGGGALVTMYQAEAEHLTLHDTPAGEIIDLRPEDLPPADGILLSAAHLGRSRLMRMWLDPAVLDELEPARRDPTLDMFNPSNGPPYPTDWLARYREAQLARIERLEAWCFDRLRAVPGRAMDTAFVVHRTLADPRCLDSALDPNDRVAGTTIWGSPRLQNEAANSMGRFNTLNGFLSQWAPCSRGDGPRNLARTSVPILLAEHTADASVFPSDNEEWAAAAGSRVRRLRLVGGNHYLSAQPALVEQLGDAAAAFAQSC